MLPTVDDMLGSLLRPWRTSATWRAAAHVALDAPMGALLFAATFPLAVVSVSLIVLFPLAVLASYLLFISAHGTAAIERTRYAALLDLQLLDASPPLTGSTWWQRHKQRLGSAGRWKEVGHGLISYPVGILTTSLLFSVWCGSIACVLLPFLVTSLPGGIARFGLFDVGPSTAWIAGIIGVVGLAVIAPWVTLGLAELDRQLGRWLLGRTERAEFAERVDALESSRIAAVDSAEAERRRIERDLHDGAQQRLIAVAMDLGVARQRLDDDPEAARALLSDAHDEVKAAMKELRDLVRGIHPVILEDRGLDAALSAVVARSNVPVRLVVDVSPRPEPSIESAAYFIVSEAIVNITRHAHASSATVEIARRGGRLTISVSDDGIGGADPLGGTGLQGLSERVAGLGGWMQVVSPPGGPTSLFVEVPCES